MKRVVLYIWPIVVAAMLAGCPSGSPSVSISINPLSITLNVGQATTFTINSPTASDSFRWQSSNASVAAVDSDGRVSAIGAGTAQITAISEVTNARVTASVTVAGVPQGSATVTITPSEATIAVGSMLELDASSTREDQTSFLWFSQDETVATVDASGVVRGVKPGTATIEARGSSPQERATAEITVVEAMVTRVVINPIDATILSGGQLALTAISTDPLDEFEWSSDLEATATVDASGLVTGTGSGAVAISALGTNSGAIGRTIITVDRPVEHRVTVSPSTVTLASGFGIQLGASTTRSGDSFTWTTDDPAVATVDQSGFVTGANVGTTNVFAQGNNPDERGVAMIRVVQGAVRIASVRPLSASVPAGESIALTATSRDSTEAFTWTSEDPDIATVNAFGVVTGVTEGTVRIGAVGATTGATGASMITVTESIVHLVSVAPASASIEVGATLTLAAASTRAGDDIAWTSADESIATVDENGLVTGVGGGSTSITATGLQSGVSGSAAIEVSEPVVQSVTVRPTRASLAPTDTIQLTAVSTEPLDTFSWTSLNPATATVSATGLVTGVAPGAVKVRATGSASGVSGSATLTVTVPETGDVTVTPSAASIDVGESVTLSGISTIVGDTIEWSSGNDTVATVDGSGAVTGAGAGTVVITATGNPSGVSDSATIEVSDPVVLAVNVLPLRATIAPSETLQLTASSTDSEETIEWSSEDEAVVAVEPATGLITGVAPGSARVIATGNNSGASGQSTITVTAPVQHEVRILPTMVSIEVDDTLRLAASSTRVGDGFIWTSEDAGVATVDPTGLISGVSPGTVVVTAEGTLSGERGTATVVVSEPPPEEAIVRPLEASILVGETVSLSAESSDASDEFIWESNDTSTASVDGAGLVMGAGAGMASVTASGTVTGASGTSTITVIEPVVHEVIVSPSSATILPAETLLLNATTTRDGDTFTWSSSNSGVATVSATGLVTGAGVGTAVITAQGSVDNERSVATITVVNPTIHAISLQPRDVSIVAGKSLLLSATSTDDTDDIVWMSSNPSAAAVDASGLVRGVRAGTAEIRAEGSNSGAVGSATVLVTAPPVHVVTVTPAVAVVEVAATAALSAISTDSADTFTWSSADVSIATVNGTGRVTGVAPGTVEILATGTSSGLVSRAMVTVLEATIDEVMVTPVTSTLFVGGTVALSAVSTEEADIFTWTSANPDVATVSSLGVVSGTGAGMTEITATGNISGARNSAKLMVNAHVVTVTPDTLGLLAGTTGTLAATTTDVGETIQWTSGNTGIATVNASGVVSGVSGGTVAITGRGMRSGAMDTTSVTVLDGIAVNPPAGTVPSGRTLQLSAISSNPNDGFTWSSGNPSVATVSANGVVTGVASGSVQIRATGTSSGVSASATITVVPVMTVTPATSVVEIGRIVALQPRLLNAGDTLSWRSSDASVATVNSSGFVGGVSVGTVDITVTASPSGAVGFAQVEVLPEFPNALLFDAEAPFTAGNRSALNTAEQYRGFACLEGIPDQFAGFSFEVRGEYFREDVSFYDEIWMMVKAQGTGAHSLMSFRSFQGNGTEVELTDYASSGAIGGQYQLLRFPLEDLSSPNFDFTRLERIGFGRREVGENFRLFIDEIWAVNLDSVDSNGGPIVGPIRSVNFGNVSVMTGGSLDVRLSNLGSSPLAVDTIAVEGAGSIAFDVSQTGFQVAPGASRDLDITFLPGMAGFHEATLVLSHNKSAFGEVTRIPLSGTGVSAQMQLSHAELNFGSIPLQGSIVRQLTITNTGNVPLEIDDISSTSGVFALSASSFELNPGAMANLFVTAVPSVLGNSGGALRFTTNDPNQQAVEIPLLLTGLTDDALGRLPLEVGAVGSSSAVLSWGEWPAADAVTISIGPEPPATPGAELPLSFEVASLPGAASSYTLEDLAAGVDVFVRVEVSLGGVPIAVQNGHLSTAGGPRAPLESKLREVHMYAPNILQLVLADFRVHSFREDSDSPDNGIDEVIGYTGETWQAGPWTVLRADGSEIAVNNVYRHSVPVGASYYDVGFDAPTRINLLDVDHMIYLELAENVGSPEVLQVTGPSFTYEILNPEQVRENRSASLDVLIPFSDRYMVTPAIQVNQVGYSPAATKRYAYVSAWLGDGGPLSLAAYPSAAQVLVESENPLTPRSAILTNLPINLRMAMDRDSGTEVRDINIAALPESDEDTYRVRIPGVGVSWPTKVSEIPVFETFYHTARGLFHNRWAGDLQPEYTDWSRPQDHGNVYTSENLEPFVFFGADTPLTGERPLLGGHHDAGDFDIRIYHATVGQMLMRAYELNQSAFTDGQLYIPESGNGIPDLLDEALWSIAAWEYLQEDDGGVRIGVESHRHPLGLYFAHLDELNYWTFSREPHFSARCAGLFAQASRLIQPYDGIRAHILRNRAIRAYDYAIANGVDATAGGTIMYGASELFRLTGEARYKEQVEATWDAFRLAGINQLSVFDRENPPVKTFTEAVQPISWDHVSGYFGSGDVVPEHLSRTVPRLNQRPAELMERIETAHGHRNPRPAMFPLTYGKGTAVGQYLFGLYAAMQYGDLDDEQYQEAFDAMSLTADYTLGCNPAGLVWITGLGSRKPLEIFHLDSLSFIKTGPGPIPGIPVYGPADNLQSTQYYIFGMRLASPAYPDNPPARRYGDVNTFIVTSEFTVWECQAPVTQLFGMLIPPGMTAPDDWLPSAIREK